MKIFTPTLVALALTTSPLILAEVLTRSGEVSGVIPMPVTAVAKINANINYFPHGADKNGKDGSNPYPITGLWRFVWDDTSPDKVDFTGQFRLGDYFTVTDAGSLGGVTRQTFYDFVHEVKGTADWDAATRTLTYNLQPKERDDSQASTVAQAKPAICEKIRGFAAGKACSAFEASSPGLEGLILTFTFDENRNSLQGEFVMIQYGGSGMTESETQIEGTLKASLAGP